MPRKKGPPNDRLKHARLLKGLSQENVADEIGTDSSKVAEWELGYTKPRIYAQQRLCAFFGMTPEELGFLTEELPPKPTDSYIYDPATPLPLSNFVGRHELLKSLKKRLSGNQNVMLSALHGLPGVGKTSIAVQLAYDHDIQAYFSDGVLWAGVGRGDPNIPKTLRRWGELLGLGDAEMKELPSDEAWAEAIAKKIGRRRLLLILDDIWEIEHALAFLQVKGPSCQYLITTRRPHIAVKFANKEKILVPELDEADSVALLAYFVPQLVKTEPENIQKLVQAVGGLPLALNLMGSYLSGQAYSNQPRRIDKALKKLRDVEERLQLQEKKGARDRHPSLPNRKTISLQAVIEISDEALQENERQALRAFSIFPPKPNTFSEKAALEVATTSGESLDLLVDVGLVEVGGQGRYMLHQTIADYASVRRTDETVGKRMAEYFAGYVDIQSKTSERELEVDEANIGQALELAHNNGYNELVILLCLGMQDFWHNHGRVERSQRYLPWGREAVEAVSSVTQRPEDRQRQADLTLAYGRLLRRVGELDEAIRVFEVNRAIRHEMQDLQGEGIVLGYISRITHTRGRIKEAEEYCQRALAIHREIGNRKEEGVDLSSLGQIAQTRGDFEEAQRYYEQSLVIRREMGVRRGEGMDLCFLGMVKLALGQQEDAERDYNQSLEIFLEEHEQAYEGVVRGELGYLAYLRGQLDDAEHYYQEAEKIVRKGQDPLTQCVLFPRMAALAASKGELEKAKELYREGLEVSRKSEYAPNIADVLLALGSFLVEKMGKREEGCPMLLEAAQRYRAMGILREKEARERYRQLGCNP